MKSQISLASIATLVALASAPVMAADMRLPPPPAPAPLAFPWTGFYLGAHMGSAWTNGEWTAIGVLGTDASIDAAGFIGGVQAGFNYQFAGGWVIGLEGDFTGSTMSKSVNGCFADPTQTCTLKNRWTALLTGRLGYAFDRSLFYVKGGAAWASSTTKTLILLTAAIFFRQIRHGQVGRSGAAGNTLLLQTGARRSSITSWTSAMTP